MINKNLVVIVSCESIQKRFEAVLKKLDLIVPVYTSHCEKAVELAERLTAQGVRLIISQGSSYHYLRRFTDTAILLLPYSSLNLLRLIKAARQLRAPVCFVGDEAHGALLRQCADLSAPENRLLFDFLEFGALDTPASLFKKVEALGCGTIVAETALCQAARQKGLSALEYDCEDFMIEYTVANACTMLALMERGPHLSPSFDIAEKLDCIRQQIAELEKKLERTAEASAGNVPTDLLRTLMAQAPLSAGIATDGPPQPQLEQLMTLKQLEEQAIQSALCYTGGDKQKAARILGIHKSTLWRKLVEQETRSDAQG